MNLFSAGFLRPDPLFAALLLFPALLRAATWHFPAAALDDLPTLHRFDLVDFATVSPSFRDAALADAIPLIGVRP